MTRLAAIDVGTNSVRLYVADVAGDDVRSVDRDLVITRLGEGVDAGRALGPEPLRRTVAAIAAYHERAREAGAERVRIAATSAVRDAANREAFLDAVRKATGLVPEVLTGEQEASLSFLGAASEVDRDGPLLVLDIGGGSTEFVVGERSVESWTSIDIGSVRLTERHVRNDPPTDAELDAMAIEADAAAVRAMSVVGRRATTLVGLAGTVTTIAAFALGLEAYDREAIHHAVLDVHLLREIDGMLNTMTIERRRALPVMPPGREDVIVAGSTILMRVMETFGFDELVVSEADILDGLIRSA